MERIELGTPDLTEENIQKLGELFPQVLTEVEGEEGRTQRAIDFDALRDLLGDVAEGGRERYQFTWPGKREAKAEAWRPINKTLRPLLGKSAKWDDTENVYIEGNNLDALKILKETYAGKVKMIYIDPPYNTGNNLIYKNNYHISTEANIEISGDYDDEGNRLVANPRTNGRFHSDWLSSIYPTLILAKDLLRKDDGVLVCAIDENEVATLSLLLGEVFGELAYEMVCVTLVHNPRGVQGTNFSYTHEYAIFVYPKGKKVISDFEIKESDVSWSQFRNWGSESLRSDAKNCFYPVLVQGGSIVGFGDVCKEDYHPNQCEFLPNDVTAVYPIDKNGIERKWRYARQSVSAVSSMLRARKSTDGYEIEIGKTFGVQKTVWNDKRYDANEYGTKIVNYLVPGGGFTFPKSLWSVYDALFAGAAADKDAIVLDFYSGSGTTAHALMKLNEHDGGRRKFILVQIPAPVPPSTESKYTTICEIAEERIRRAGAKIKDEVEEANRQLKLGEEPKKVPDIGFRVMKIESSNFNDVSFAPDETSQQMLLDFSDNLKDGRSDLDILFEVLPKFRIPYSAKIEEIDICGKRCFNVEDGELVACFDKNVGIETIEEIAKMQPLYAVLRDASMADDATHANFEELFKVYSPDTVRRVI